MGQQIASTWMSVWIVNHNHILTYYYLLCGCAREEAWQWEIDEAAGQAHKVPPIGIFG
jgi:hypothetical protein